MGLTEATPPQTVRFTIEVPRWSVLKRDASGRIEFATPVPCPFNYGSAPDHPGQDGDLADVVVLGPRLPLGASGELPVQATVRFLDAGVVDDKWVCSARALTRRDRASLRAFFTAYAAAKRATAPVRGARGPTRFLGVLEHHAP